MKANLYTVMVIILGIFSNCTTNERESQNYNITNLGVYVQISLSVSNIKHSLKFYENLGFKKMGGREDETHPWAMISDGKIIILLSRNKFPSPALTYFAPDMERRTDSLQMKGINISVVSDVNSKFSSAVLSDPAGFGITLIQFNSQRMNKPSGTSYLQIGEFDEIMIPVTELDSVLSFWETLGFELVTQSTDPYPWAQLSDGLMKVGLHMTSAFTSPALFYLTDSLSAAFEILEGAGITPIQKHADTKSGAAWIEITSPDGQLILIKPKK